MDEAVMLKVVFLGWESLGLESKAEQLGIRRMTIISEHKGVINFHLTRDGNELKIGSALTYFDSVEIVYKKWQLY